jgi:two-component system chemotaxis response regulator CheB
VARPDTAAVVTVLVVAGTRTRIGQLERLLDDPGFELIGTARDAMSAEEAVLRERPAAVLVDLALLGGGLEAIERIMASAPTPIVVCGAAADHPEAALAAGAVDVVGPLDAPSGTPDFADALRRHLRMASRVSVITHPRARLRARTEGSARVAAGQAAQTPAPRHASPPDAVPDPGPFVVAVGASTGGPPALATILRDLPETLDAAVVVVQHMAEGFVEGLARWLDGVGPLPVVVAGDGDRLVAGTVYLAPAGRNLYLRAGAVVELADPLPGQYHVPGVDATFASVAEVCGPRSVGVLLTGMGRDGAVGLRAMRMAGARTFCQDEPTSVVWGMPGAAKALNAVDRELPIGAICGAVTATVRQRAQATGVT